MKSLIDKQFALRGGGGHSTEYVKASVLLDTELAKSARVRAAASTSRKISGLTVATRESNLNLFLEGLRKNFKVIKEKEASESSGGISLKQFDELDLLDCAVGLEFDIFSSTKVVTTYRRACVFKVSENQLDYTYIFLFNSYLSLSLFICQWNAIKKETEAMKLSLDLENYTPTPSVQVSPATVASHSPADPFDDSFNVHLVEYAETEPIATGSVTRNSRVTDCIDGSTLSGKKEFNRKSGKFNQNQKREFGVRQQTLAEYFKPIPRPGTPNSNPPSVGSSKNEDTEEGEIKESEDEHVILDSESEGEIRRSTSSSISDTTTQIPMASAVEPESDAMERFYDYADSQAPTLRRERDSRKRRTSREDFMTEGRPNYATRSDFTLTSPRIAVNPSIPVIHISPHGNNHSTVKKFKFSDKTGTTTQDLPTTPRKELYIDPAFGGGEVRSRHSSHSSYGQTFSPNPKGHNNAPDFGNMYYDAFQEIGTGGGIQGLLKTSLPPYSTVSERRGTSRDGSHSTTGSGGRVTRSSGEKAGTRSGPSPNRGRNGNEKYHLQNPHLGNQIDHIIKVPADTTEGDANHEKAQMANLIVATLMPYYKHRTIGTKDLFKQTARDLTHQAIEFGLKSKGNQLSLCGNVEHRIRIF